MSRFNASVLCISAFVYSVFISFNTVEILFLVPIVFLMFCEYKKLIPILKKLLFLNLFIVMIFVVLSLQGNMDEAINIYFRTNMIILFNLLLFSQSNGFDIVRALNELRFPTGFVSTVYFTLKMIQTLNEEVKRVKDTLKARGFCAGTSLFDYETYGNLFGHIFVESIRKSNALKDSFELRGFHGRIYLINNNKLGIYDALLLLVVNFIVLKGVL